LNDLPTPERPRERLQDQGPAALSTAELLAIVLRTGRPGASAVDLGTTLLGRFTLSGLAAASVAELCQISGLGPAKAVQVKAALELGRRLVARAGSQDSVQIAGPADAARLLMGEMAFLEQEHLRVVLLNTKNRVLGVHEVYKGSVNASLVRVGEVYREAVRRNCPALIVAHNHPSGDPAPSPEDIHVTRQLADGGRLLDIELLDHLIIAAGRWVSLRERGLGFDA
jgi:DNA repair protein RadC